VIDWCCMCKKSGESINRLLLHCDVVRVLWVSMLSPFGVEPKQVVELLASWRGQFGTHRCKMYGG